MKQIKFMSQDEIQELIGNPPKYDGIKSIQIIELVDEYSIVTGYAIMARKERKDIGLIFNGRPVFIEDKWDAVKCHKAIRKVN